jgi:U5 snRNP protein, DIM1 family
LWPWLYRRLIAAAATACLPCQVDLDQVPDFISMYELFDDCTTMFFYRNKHIMVDLGTGEWLHMLYLHWSLVAKLTAQHVMCDVGTGDNNKINWALTDKQELIDIIEIVYRGARKGRGLVISPKDYSTKYRY